MQVIEVLLRALILAEEESAPEISVDHLLTALDSPTAGGQPVEPATGSFAPAPRRDKPLSSEATAAIAAAGVVSAPDLEQLTIALRSALLASKGRRTN